MKCCILGERSGGYVAGIRSAQVGLDGHSGGLKYGGTCLIRGCIPSKAIIHAAERFRIPFPARERWRAHGDQRSRAPSLNMKDLVDWKDAIVIDRLNKGVESLLKTAGAEVIHGWATFTGPKTCRVELDGEHLDIEANNVILATGSSHIDLPFMPCDEKLILSNTGALDLQEAKLLLS